MAPAKTNNRTFGTAIENFPKKIHRKLSIENHVFFEFWISNLTVGVLLLDVKPKLQKY